MRFIINWAIKPVLMLFLIFVLTTQAVPAQYFGRNKVQYEDFDFRTIKTDHFKILHYLDNERVAADATRMAERWYDRLAELLQHDLKGLQPLILYNSHADFQQTNVVFGMIGQGTGGVTEGLQRRITLPLTGVYKENDHVIGHELVHAFHYDIMGRSQSGMRASNYMPLWFIEGMSEYLSVGTSDPLTAMWMRDAVLHDSLPTIGEISTNMEYFPYRYGHAIWSYIAGKWGDQIVGGLFKTVVTSNWESGFKRALDISIDSLSIEWRQAIIDKYEPQLADKTLPSDVGKPLLKKGKGMDIGPSLSPNGEYIVFISQRDLFTLDLYLADAETGEIIDKLARSNTDAHFDALRFFNSAGAWSPDGSQFAMVVFEDGDNAIIILEVPSGDIARKIELAEVDDIQHLAWSPDGNSMAFSGSVDAISDIYILSLENDSLRQLTRDRYADLQPAWSPDGETIAFVTDRGEGTDFEKLTYGNMEIAMLDMETLQINRLSMRENVKHINPQYSPDGNSIYFISDPGGFSNMYRYALDENRFYKITDIATGISGITELSPALSVAKNTGLIAFNVFEKMQYNVYSLTPEEAEGEPVDGNVLAGSETMELPPDVVDRYVTNYLNNPGRGLLMTRDFSSSDYSPTLRLIYAGQVSVGMTVDRFGTSLGGSTNLLFSDLLGNHYLSVSALINGGITDLGGEVVYQNRGNRFNYGAAVGHIPFRTIDVESDIDTISVNGQPTETLRQNLIRKRIFLDRISLLGEYPLSRNRRFEFGTGYSHISYDYESETIWSVNGIIVDEEDTDIDAPSGLNLFNANAAYVGDYSFFGFTSPIRGRRYRLEVEPTVGNLKYLTILADYRHYLMANPFTFAFRAMHQGRYLEDSEDDRLSIMFLGYETLVRGYSVGSIEVSECSGTGEPGECPEFDRLIGSKIAVFNAEVRMPLFGNDQYGLIYFPYLPTELALFFDGGIAWTKNESPTWEITESSNKRIPVFSAGLAARVNLFGYIVMQFYYAMPFQRPEKDGQFGFVIAPGW